MNPQSEVTCTMCHAPRNSSQPSLQPASPEDSFDDFEEFPRDDVEATTRFAAQTVMPKEAPKIVRDTAESEEDLSSDETPVAEKPKTVLAGNVAPVVLGKPAGKPSGSGLGKPAGKPSGKPAGKPVVKLGAKTAVKPVMLKLREEKTAGKEDVVIKKKSLAGKEAGNVKAKATSMKVVSKPAGKREVDVFAELGMGAE